MNYSKQSVIENQLILITPYNYSFAISFSHKIIRYERVHLLFSVERATTSINDDFFTSRFFSPFYRSIQNQTQILIVNACYNNIIPFFSMYSLLMHYEIKFLYDAGFLVLEDVRAAPPGWGQMGALSSVLWVAFTLSQFFSENVLARDISSKRQPKLRYDRFSHL